MAQPSGACPHCGDDDPEWTEAADGRWYCKWCRKPAPIDKPPSDRRSAHDSATSSAGKPFRYRGPKRDYGRDPRYRRVLEAAEVARKTGRITRAERDVANAIYWHQRRHWNHREKTQRVTFAELAAEAATGAKTAQRAIPSLVRECGLQIVTPAAGDRNGAVYRFPPRTEE